MRVDIEDLLTQAALDVDSAGVEAEMRPMAYLLAGLARVLGDGVPASMEVVLPSRDGASRPLGAEDWPSEAGSQGYEALAAQAGVSAGQVREVFDIDSEGGLSLVVPSSRLPRSSATAARQVTLLVVGARQVLGLEDWTGLHEAREWCRQYAVLDANNYAASVTRMEREFSFKGRGVSRQARLTMPGREAWSALLRALTGASETE